jgi:hypothetical protein
MKYKSKRQMEFKSSSAFKRDNVGYVLYSLHVCVWARQVRQLHLTIPIVVPFASCASGAS